MYQEVASMDQLRAIVIDKSFAFIVIDFYADWCGPCRAIAPKYHELAEKHPKAAFLKVNVDRVKEAATYYGVTAMPTFVFLKSGSGEKVETVVGANIAKLQTTISNLYASA